MANEVLISINKISHIKGTVKLIWMPETTPIHVKIKITLKYCNLPIMPISQKFQTDRQLLKSSWADENYSNLME